MTISDKEVIKLHIVAAARALIEINNAPTRALMECIKIEKVT